MTRCRLPSAAVTTFAATNLAPRPFLRYPHPLSADDPAGGFPMLTIESLRARVRRLNDLCRGLRKEVNRLETEKNDPLDYMERQAYRLAIHNGIEALEQARIVLAKAVQRLEESAAR